MNIFYSSDYPLYKLPGGSQYWQWWVFFQQGPFLSVSKGVVNISITTGVLRYVN